MREIRCPAGGVGGAAKGNGGKCVKGHDECMKMP